MIVPPIHHTYLSSAAGATGLSDIAVPTDSLSALFYNYHKTFTHPNTPVGLWTSNMQYVKWLFLFSVKYRSTHFVTSVSFPFIYLISAFFIEHLMQCL
jgi:hypothetical protein